jgi:prepilin-type N-terminal cleavage/methylation domain-containing protein
MLKSHGKRQKRSVGFTLTELLISLAILGEIATFTIPKILTSQQSAKRAAVLKESISTIQAVIYNGILTRNLTLTNSYSYISSNVNAVKLCPTNARTEGCWTQPLFDSNPQGPGFILPNGATVSGFETPWSPNDNGNGQWAGYFFIDWNGADGPNLEGQDQMILVYGFGTATWQNAYDNWGTLRPGEIKGSGNWPLSVAAYNALW